MLNFSYDQLHHESATAGISMESKAFHNPQFLFNIQAQRWIETQIKTLNHFTYNVRWFHGSKII